MNGDPFLLLLLLVGGLAFTFGGFIGAQLTISANHRQDRHRALERRALNEIWQQLRVEGDIDKAPWMARADRRELTRRSAGTSRSADPTRP